MSNSFYSFPSALITPLRKEIDLKGTITSMEIDSSGLTTALRSLGLQADDSFIPYDDLVDVSWWRKQKDSNVDWIIGSMCSTYEPCLEYIFAYGTQAANKGLILLERLSFLEPTRKRRQFLQDTKLSNLIVLNPRPQFRPGSSKDSVTSAWFVFRRPDMWADETRISYALDWDTEDTKKLPRL